MNVGMLWFDNDSKADLNAKVERAADYYNTKYGKMPTLCFVHPSMLPPFPEPVDEKDKNIVVGGRIEVRSNTAVLPHHFWIGVNGNCDTDTNHN